MLVSHKVLYLLLASYICSLARGQQSVNTFHPYNTQKAALRLSVMAPEEGSKYDQPNEAKDDHNEDKKSYDY